MGEHVRAGSMAKQCLAVVMLDSVCGQWNQTESTILVNSRLLHPTEAKDNSSSVMVEVSRGI